MTAPESGILSTQCVFCGWLWKGRPQPIEQRCGECEDKWEADRGRTLQPYNETVITLAKNFCMGIGAPDGGEERLNQLVAAVTALNGATEVADAVLLPVRVNCVYPYPQVKA